MATYTRMGAYLLSGELTSDPFGKVHRGIAIVGNAFDRHLLVRAFSDEMLHAGLAAKLPEAAKVLPLLGGSKSFGLGYRVEGGSVPHVACDYVPGRSLAQMIEKARHEQIPFGVDHALSVIQGLAQGIILMHGKGLAHGSLSPHSVWVSFEGAAQIIDVPYAGIVRSVLPKAPFLKASLEPYTREGAPNVLLQDLYALGAILYELLTFEKLPLGPNVGGALSAISLKAAQEVTEPVPQEIQGLLRRLLLVAQPYESVASFNAELEKVLYDGDYSPTTFNMAFFMHTLFREENDRDGQAMKADQAEDFTPYTSAVEAAKQRPMGMDPVVHQGEVVAQKSTLVKAGIGAAAVLLLVVGVGGYLFVSQRRENEKLQSQLASLQQEQAVAQQKAADLAGQEALAQKDKESVAKKISEAKSSTEKEQLQKQLAEAEKKQEELRNQRLEEERKLADSKAKAQLLAASTSTKPPAPSVQQPPAPMPSQAAPATAAAAPPPGPQPQPQPAPAAKAPEPTRPAAAPPAQVAPTQAAPPPTAPAPVQAQPAIELPAKLVNQSSPAFPARAKNAMNPHRLREITVQVRVFVDSRGNPSKTTIVEGVEGPWGYNEAAVDAALACTYSPATKDGKPVNGHVVVNFRFPKGR